MPVHERQQPPAGHGELLTVPDYSTWAGLAEDNSRRAMEWPEDLRLLRRQARSEALAVAARVCAAAGIAVRPAGDRSLVIMTGHQPELFHPGVWAKHFLMQRLTEETGAVGIDLVVDTDAATDVELAAPCLQPTVRVCRVPLAAAQPGASFAQCPAPDRDAIERFRERGTELLAPLPAPALGRHFSDFCDALDRTHGRSTDLGWALTLARREYERSAGTDYLGLPLSAHVRTPSFARFAASIIADAPAFASVVNEALAEYRAMTGTRSKAQPFPDLDTQEGRTEAPFWLLAGGARHAVSVDRAGRLWAGGAIVADVGTDARSAEAALLAEDLWLAPKAIALTMFERVFVADLFVHGTGGGRYDRVTDAVIERHLGIRPPAYAVASMTLLLPLGCQMTTDADVADAEAFLHRLRHNPDQVLADVEFDSVAERAQAEALASEKRTLVEAIGEAGADRKALGMRIRAINVELAALLEPVAAQAGTRASNLRAARDASAVLTDRTYPYCLWDPREVADKVR